MRLSDQSFARVADVFHKISGIRLEASKRQMVIGRLQRLAGEKGIGNLDDYVDLVLRGDDQHELVRIVDRLTTNETYFFREPAHFDYLAHLLAQRPRGVAAGQFRVWSAASSSGEEAYSIAMLLADKLGRTGWEVVGTDLSTSVVQAAQTALYPMERARHTPADYLKRFCLKGQGPYEGKLLIDKTLRAQVRFMQANLTQTLPDIGLFDVIFLRNVLIYFDAPSKLDIVQRVAGQLKPDGILFTGHSESLSKLPAGLIHVQPAVYARA